MIKHLSNVCAVIILLIVIWGILSWVDVLNHNDPYLGDYKYNPYNVFVLLGGE